jgi:hypothetical protein
MRVQWDGKVYIVESYDIESGIYKFDGKEIEEKEMQAFILTNEEFVELKNFKATPKKKVEVVVNE